MNLENSVRRQCHYSAQSQRICYCQRSELLHLPPSKRLPLLCLDNARIRPEFRRPILTRHERMTGRRPFYRYFGTDFFCNGYHEITSYEGKVLARRKPLPLSTGYVEVVTSKCKRTLIVDCDNDTACCVRSLGLPAVVVMVSTRKNCPKCSNRRRRSRG